MKYSAYLISLFIIFLLLACSHHLSTSYYQPVRQGESVLKGRVIDLEAKPICNASISISGSALGGIVKTNTDDKGYYYIPFLPSGHRYYVEVTADGYETIKKRNVAIKAFSSLDLTFAMAPYIDLPIDSATPTINKQVVGGRIVIEHHEKTDEPIGSTQ